MDILEELWNGKIYPNERPVRKDSEYAHALQNVITEKERFLPTLSPKLQTQVKPV